jgi:hypothetical protein
MDDHDRRRVHIRVSAARNSQLLRVGTTDVGIICGMPAVTRGSPET